MSSSGLRIFISLKNNLIDSTQKLRLCSLTEPVTRVFDVTRVTELFEIYASESLAVKGY